jgi:translation elongation factor P/translation initiation factor 5A
MKLEVECDFEKISDGLSGYAYFIGTEHVNEPVFRIDTFQYSWAHGYWIIMDYGGYEKTELFIDDIVDSRKTPSRTGSFKLYEGFCTKGEYMEFVIKQVIFDIINLDE